MTQRSMYLFPMYVLYVCRLKPCGVAVPYTDEMTQCIPIKRNTIILEYIENDAHGCWYSAHICVHLCFVNMLSVYREHSGWYNADKYF